MTEDVKNTVVNGIMVVGVLTCCALLHSVCDLKAIQMNQQYRLNQELYKFNMSHNATEMTKNICCVKGEVAVDYNTETRWFKKFCIGCKNLGNQAKSGRLKTMASRP